MTIMYESISVTNLLGTFFRPFNTEEQVERIVTSERHREDPGYAYYGKSREEILQAWADTNILGSKLHHDIDLALSGEAVPVDVEAESFSQFEQFLVEHPSWKPYKTETALTSHVYKINGVADAIFEDTETDNLILVDWKRAVLTGPTLDYGERCLAPLDDCPSTNFCKYTLQLNLYKYMLEENGISVSDMYLVGFHPDNKNKKYVSYKIPERKGIVYRILGIREAQLTVAMNEELSKNEEETKFGRSPSIMSENTVKLSPKQRDAYEMMSSGRSIFLTGRGGCGKSTLIKLYYNQYQNTRQVGLTSTTGTSALLIGGVTLYSFLGIGLGTGSVEQLYQEIMFKRPHKIKQRWRELQTLIIDEVSMLTPELFDKLEVLARSIRNSKLPFGGIQIILTGDFYQLPCIGSENLCFDAKAWDTCIEEVVELGHSFRQSDPEFEKCLDEVRIGELSEKSKALLLSRVNADLTNADGIKPTRVYSLNRDVNFENEEQLNKLVRANPELEFYEYKLEYKVLKPNVRNADDKVKKSCFAPEVLQICVGAQVMLIYNLDLECKLANGSRGIVTDFDEAGFPVVKFVTGESRVIGYQEWSIEEEGEKLISVVQVPLKVAYAGTIHKLQGASLDLVDIDCGHIFEYHQIYVGLSRARTLEGLSLRNFNPDKIQAHPAVKEFYAKCLKK